MKEQEVEKQFAGKTIARIVKCEDECHTTSYRVETQDGQWIEFFGGSTAEVNTDCWCKVKSR